MAQKENDGKSMIVKVNNKDYGAGQTSSSIVPKTDKITFLNGIIKEGNLISLTNDKVVFVHQGETLSYEFNKKEIEKIEHASGRDEIINVKKSPDSSIGKVVTKNRVAVLPMGYIADGYAVKIDDMRFRLQEIVIDFMGRAAAELKFKDPVEVNALLLKNEISEYNIRKFTAKELASILQVEYVIMGSVMQDKGKLRTVTTRNNSFDGDWKISRRNNNTNTTVNQDIDTEVSLSIYNDAGEKIYSKLRHSLLSEVGAYKATLHYLLKRTPLYKR